MKQEPVIRVEWSLCRQETVLVGGTPVSLAARPRAVLLRLMTSANQIVTTDQLIDSLWPATPPKSARNSVARFVADLRHALGSHRGRVVTEDGGYRLVVQPGELDLDVVDAALASSAAVDGMSAEGLRRTLDDLEATLELVGSGQNPLLDHVADGAVIQQIVAERHMAVLAAVADMRTLLGDPRSALPLLEEGVATHPYDEGLWRRLMVVLDAVGRPADALRAGDRLRNVLAEIGLVPSSTTLAAEAAIAERMPNGSETVWTGGDQVMSAGDGIADPGTSLIDRVGELKALHGAVRAHRLVSIVGIGGSGKTRLALGTIRALRSTGVTVHEAPLRSVTDPTTIVPMIAEVMGVPPGAKALDGSSLAAALGPDPFVLVLDNCEHVRETCVDIVQALIDRVPGARVLTTSREALGVGGEHLFTAPALGTRAVDGGLSPAAELFVDRAGLAPPSPATAETIEAVCRSLAGLPLAIEVASAQLAYMSIEQLGRRISPSARAGDEPPVLALTEVIDWSWDLLTADQQALLARMSVFAGGCSRKALDAVAGGGQGNFDDDLDQLVRRGLVTSSQLHGEDRYEIAEPVLEFAASRLADRGETKALTERLARWVDDRFGRWTTAQHHCWDFIADELLRELPNATAALTHLFEEGRIEDAAWLADKCTGLWTNHRSPSEALRWLTPVIDDDTLSDQVRSAAAGGLVLAHHTLGNLDQMTPLGTLSLELAAGEPWDWIPGLTGYLSMWSLVAPTPLESEAYSAMSFASAEASPSRELNLALASMYRGNVAFLSRNYEGALACFQDAKQRARHPGRLLLIAETNEALSLYLTGRRDAAAEATRNWRSRPGTDHWHYILEIVRAVVVGGAEDPHQATKGLAEAVRSMPDALVWGQSDVVQTGFALLADFRGEHDLANELLETTANRDFVLLGFTIEHLLEQRGQTSDEDWLALATEFWSRVVPDDMHAGATSVADLLERWQSGAQGLPTAAP